MLARLDRFASDCAVRLFLGLMTPDRWGLPVVAE